MIWGGVATRTVTGQALSISIPSSPIIATVSRGTLLQAHGGRRSTSRSQAA